MRDYPILHGSKSTWETIQFYMDVNQHVETIQFYMEVNQLETIHFTWIVSDVDLHACKITVNVETIQFYMEVNQHRDYPFYMDVNQQWETIQFYMDVNQHVERLSNFTWK